MVDSNPRLVPTEGLIESGSAELRAPVAHVILVHGIGEISPGAVMEAAIDGIAAALPDVAFPAMTPPMQLDDRERDVVAARIRKVSLSWGIHYFTLTEFHWADEARKMRWKRRPIDATLKFVEMIGELPSLGLQPKSSPFAKRCARCLGWVLRITALCIVIGTFLMVVAALGFGAFELIHGNSAIPLDTPLWFRVVSSVFTAGIAGLFLVGLPSLVAIGAQVGRRLVAHRDRQRSRVAFATGVATAVVALLTPFGFMLFLFIGLWWGVVLVIGRWLGRLGGAVVAALSGAPTANLATVAQSALTLVLVVVVSFYLLKSVIWLYRQLAVVGNLLGDVIHYFATDDRGELKPLQRQIQSSLWELIECRFRENPSARIVLVAHSLGTVIVTDLLTRQRSKDPERPDLAVDLVTAGSPLRRLIHRVMPHRADAPLEIRRKLRAVSGVRVERWFNCFRKHDVVGQALSNLPLDRPWHKRREPWGDATESIAERPLRHRKGLPTGHSNYWSDPRFFQVIAGEIIAPLLTARGTVVQQAVDKSRSSERFGVAPNF